MKAIIKQFFLHGVGNRFFQSAKSILKFKIFKNEGQEMLFVAIGTFICYLILLVLEIKELMQ
jgi:hypothetical protein